MLVRDVMVSPVVSVLDSTLLRDVAVLMQSRNIGCIVVNDPAGKLRGIITESDFTGVARCVPFTLDLAPVVFGARAATMSELQAIYASAAKLPAAQVMSTKVHSVAETDALPAVIKLMLDRDLKHVPVVRDGVAIGMIARHDLLKAMLQN